MGPTIKPGSNIDQMLPPIISGEKSTLVRDEGENEPILRTLSNALQEGDAREIDGIHFWTNIEESNSIAKVYKRRLSLSMAHQAGRATGDDRNNGGRDTSFTRGSQKSQKSRASNSIRNQKEHRTSKQDLCQRLGRLEGNRSPSPTRIARLYAMLQSTDKGAARLDHKQGKNFFNENIRMNYSQSKRMLEVNDHLSRLQNQTALQNKDSLSRLADAIEIFRNERQI